MRSFYNTIFVATFLVILLTGCVKMDSDEREENPCNLIDCGDHKICIVNNGKAKCVEQKCHDDDDCNTGQVCCKKNCKLTPCAYMRCAKDFRCIAYGCYVNCEKLCKKDSQCGPTECCRKKNSQSSCLDVCKDKHCKKNEICQAIKKPHKKCKAECVKKTPVCNPECKPGFNCEFVKGEAKCVQQKCKDDDDCNPGQVCCGKFCKLTPCAYRRCAPGFSCVAYGCYVSCEKLCKHSSDCGPTQCCRKKNSQSSCLDVCKDKHCKKGTICQAIKKPHKKCKAKCVCAKSCKPGYHCVVNKNGTPECIPN